MKPKYFIQGILLGILLLLQSCQIDIMNNRRILVKGRIVDSNNNPIANISVRSETSNESTLGETVSDKNGEFQFTSLITEGTYPYDIVVNLKSYRNYWNDGYEFGDLENLNYSGKRYFNNTRNRDASLYNLGTIQLNEVAKFTLLLQNTPGDTNTLAFRLDYETAICKIDLITNGPEDCQVRDVIYQQLDSTSSNLQINLQSQLDTNVLFKYVLNGEPEQIISIPLSNPETTYVFEY